MGPYPVSDWEPEPLQLPLDGPFERTPAPADGDAGDEDRREDRGRTVIVIDLC
jgi:hypothetical protein